MIPQTAEAQDVSEVYELLRVAAARRRPVAATYDGLLRLLCPQVLGRKSGRLRVFCYPFGGNSNSGLAMASEAMGGWRCFAVEKLSQVELRAGSWYTEPRSPRQIRIGDVDFDGGAQSGDNPQTGQ